MASAEQIADLLGYEFLRQGNFSASTGPIEAPELIGAASAGAELSGYNLGKRAGYRLDTGFEGLAVQSVGYEIGPENPKVHIYLTHGSAKLMRSISKPVEGVPVQLHRMGPISVRPESAGTATNRGHIFERGGRICCGTSSGPTSENSSGTLGAIVRLQSAEGLFLLSNNHVFSGCNHVPMNQPIMAPSNMDGRPDARAPGEIGRHYLLHELRSGDPHFVDPCDADIGLARATDEGLISSWQGDSQYGFDTPAQTTPPRTFMKVKKFGRTTGLTEGVVQVRVKVPTAITYTSKFFKGVVWFHDVWTVKGSPGQPFAISGDSGSLVVSADGTKSVGLVFAANTSGEYAWIIPMAQILNAFGGLQIVSGHNV